MGIFSVVPPTEPCALRSTQPLKVSTRDFFWGKGGRCVWLTTYHPCSAKMSRKSGALTYPEPLGPSRPVAGDLYFFISLIKGAFVGKRNFDVIKMHGTMIKKTTYISEVTISFKITNLCTLSIT